MVPKGSQHGCDVPSLGAFTSETIFSSFIVIQSLDGYRTLSWCQVLQAESSEASALQELAFRWGGANTRARNETPGPELRTLVAHVEASEHAVHRVCQAGQARAPPQRRARLHRVWRTSEKPSAGARAQETGLPGAPGPFPAARCPVWLEHQGLIVQC